MIKVIGADVFIRDTRSMTLKVSKDIIPQLTKQTYVTAQSLAPVDTGAVKKAIRYYTTAKMGVVELNQPTHSDGRMRPYHMWMHGVKTPSKDGRGYDTSKGRYSPKSGRLGPSFMWRAAEAGQKLAAQLTEELMGKAGKKKK
jgi:hypothetical protein